MILNILYVPYRFFFVLITGGFSVLQFALIRLFKGKDAYPLGTFYQRLFERLEGTYIKIGQALSIRYDVLSEEQCQALSALQDNVKPFSPQKGIKIISNELKKKGQTVQQAFAHLEPKPFASASFSQVYKAVDHEGNHLAVKVKRPEIRRLVFADTAFLKFWRLFFSVTGIGKRMGVIDIIDEVVNVLFNELNYVREARFIEMFNGFSNRLPFFKAPDIYKNKCTNNILTMELITGISLRELLRRSNGNQSDIVFENGNRISINSVTNKIYEIMMRSIFEHGIFHADPHPGNILVMDNGQIAYIDFGIIGTLDGHIQQQNLEYFYYLTQNQTEKAAETFTRILTPTSRSRTKPLIQQTRLDIEYYLLRVHSKSYKRQQRSTAELYINSIRNARAFGYRLPENVLLFYKTLFTTDNVLITLDPDFDSTAETKRMLIGINRRRLENNMDFDRVMWSTGQMAEFVSNLPNTFKGLKDLIIDNSTGRKGFSKTPSYYLRMAAGKIATFLILAALLLLFVKFVWSPGNTYIDKIGEGDVMLICGLLAVAGLIVKR